MKKGGGLDLMWDYGSEEERGVACGKDCGERHGVTKKKKKERKKRKQRDKGRRDDDEMRRDENRVGSGE
ncbi:hypothetical protein J1N35_026837 [Gossypium stocksii]|uniref:Uncharacterized protein n=1 Tax=Gossypium stocksii TaxID=47602 RepID=A0A9D3ZZ62_9ROSI|nr:hypothetical protein J1N35_026837 [Gossypium stocksii]